MSERALGQMIDAVLAGHEVDWRRAEALHPASTPQLRQLRLIEELAAGSLAPSGDIARARRDVSWTWADVVRLVVTLIAAAQIAAALGGYFAGIKGPAPVPPSVDLVAPAAYFVALVGFGGTAVWLFVGGRGDSRASALGTFLLLIGVSFAPRFLQPPSPAAAVFGGMYLETFLPAALWGFIRQFPRTVHYSRVDRFCVTAEHVSLVVGTVLMLANLLIAYGVAGVPRILVRTDPSGIFWYWSFILGMLAPAPLVLILRGRQAAPSERRRLAVFSLGFGIVLLTVAVELAMEVAVPSFQAYATKNRAALTPVFFGVLLVLPVAAAYAVLVDNVLDVRSTVGRVARYLLARHVALAITFVPWAVFAWYLYANRDRTVVELVAGGTGLVLVAAFLLGLLLTLAREPALAFIDRRFQRQAADLPAKAASVTAGIGSARSRVELAELVDGELRSALSVAHAVMYDAAASDTHCRGVHRDVLPLPRGTALWAMLSAERQPLVVGQLARLLPEDEEQWCGATATSALVPIASVGDRTVGFLAVGPKLSGDVLTRSEQAFLGTVASAVALRLGALAPAGDRPGIVEQEPAGECRACHRILASAVASCACGGATQVSAIPSLLAEKFRAQARIGAGGMGIVYRAVDITLSRPVALKTLGRLSANAADRLAIEARMMATVSHPNLATIFGVERWRQTPVLVLEFFEAGTLVSRLRNGPQPIGDAIRLGLVLSEALERLHAEGMLHRDIKPSNIGFTRDGVPKLLDFGLATLLAGDEPLRRQAGESELDASQTQSVPTVRGHRLAGTPLYVPPEALEGAAPGVGFDLWALALVLFEAIAGRHPFEAASVSAVLKRVSQVQGLDLRKFRGDCPAPLAKAFEVLLAREPAARPSTARELRAMLAAQI